MSRTIPLTLVEGEEGQLYAKQPKVYPREVGGRFQRLRIVAVFWLLGMFYVFPWLRWDGHQAVLFDLPARKFHIFSLTFWPQDFFYMTWLLVMAGLALFFFTALAGRLWCGYACPQTVWTEVFLWIERRIEGDRNRRMKLDAGPWNRDRIWRKSLKQFLWIAFALWTGFTFVGFFTPIRELAAEIAQFRASGWETFWVVFYGFATYGNAGYLREQVCKYMCPYARFQGAMFDRDTLIISYDDARGEPRGSRKKNADPKALGLGDCIDCLACVQVCPTGIDIRNGLQVGCIACAACIDACDAVMDKMAYPRGLIRYTTENALGGRRARVLRPRTIAYAALLLALVSGFAWSVAHRSMLLAEILRDRNALWRPGPAGTIENSYTVKLVNKGDHEIELKLRVAEPAYSIVGDDEFEVDAGNVASIPLTLRAPAGAVHGRNDITLEFAARGEDDDHEHEGDAGSAESVRVTTRFFAPESP
ncbi:MAG TPA: cytochrome c oxidase accessory protein CcoG [Rhodanobacteraceae bacterium]